MVDGGGDGAVSDEESSAVSHAYLIEEGRPLVKGR